MSNDDEVRTVIFDAATKAGEQMWPMPLPDDLQASMDSPVADIANIGDKYGGMLVAGLFLRYFVPDGQRWAHVDIAGPSFNDRSRTAIRPRVAPAPPYARSYSSPRTSPTAPSNLPTPPDSRKLRNDHGSVIICP